MHRIGGEASPFEGAGQGAPLARMGGMSVRSDSGASLERIVEAGDLGLEVLHPGGMQVTRELAEFCDIGEGDRVLDVACGTGESACFLAERFGCRVVGVDVSQAMIRRARLKALESELPVEFLPGDAHRLPFESDRYDVVISECTLCLLEKERALGEMMRVARPGGHVGMHDICWKPDTPHAIKRRLAEIEGERPETIDGWMATFTRIGLIDVTAVDRSDLIPAWMRETKARLGLRGQIRLGLHVLSLWGLRGLRDVWRSQRIFASSHTGYAIVTGKKPDPAKSGGSEASDLRQ